MLSKLSAKLSSTRQLILNYDYRTNGKELSKWIWQNRWAVLLSSICTGIGTLLFLFILIYLGLFGIIPSGHQLLQIRNPVASTIYGLNGEIIGNIYLQNRSNIDSSEVGHHIKEALIAIEDVRFYNHRGIDYRSLGRVLVKTIILQKRSSGGGSTITQQVAKNIYGRKKHFVFSGIVNKIREMLIARRMEAVYSKDEILLLYLNTVSFGENLYGLEKAAHRFFGKTPQKLTLNESATLVGLLKAPSYYNPKNNPERAKGRRNTVLSQMHKYGFLTQEEVDAEIGKEIVLNYQESKISPQFAAYYKEYMLREFDNWAKDNPKSDGSIYDAGVDGLKIYTSVHPSIQRSAERAMNGHMKRLQKSFDANWDIIYTGGKEEFIKSIMLSHPIGQKMQSEGRSIEEIRSRFDQLETRKMWTWDGLVDVEISLLDYTLYDLTRLHTGILSLDARNGRILAYVGGNDYGYSQYDQITIPRQAGSTFKPIVYLASLESGNDPCQFYSNELITYNQYEGWTPRNSDGNYGGSYSMFGALSKSINTISVKIMLGVGAKRVVKLARDMGIESALPAVPSLVLGTADVTLMEMVRAYSTIANRGLRVTPYSILKIENEEGEVIYSAKPKVGGSYIASPENFEKLQLMMRRVITEGSGAAMNQYNIATNVIGKTGTTQNQSDGWFIASSPEVTVGSWVGTMDKRMHFKSLRMGAGASTALPHVAAVFRDLSLWKTPYITDFQYTIPDFNCVSYSPLSPEEAALEVVVDSTTVDSSFNIQDTIAITLDSLQ